MEAKTKRIRIGLVAAISLVILYMGAGKLRGISFWGGTDPGECFTVLVANRYIAAFSVITPDLVRTQDFPKAYVAPGALRAKSDLANENGQKLYTAAISIPEGQPLTRALLNDASQKDTLGSLIRPGKVAVSFEMDKAHGVGGWVRPGDTVALFGATPLKKTRLLFPSMIVVAVDNKRLGDKSEEGQTAEDNANGGTKILTVLVAPSEAAAIIEAREVGTLSVVLRSLGDDYPWPIK